MKKLQMLGLAVCAIFALSAYVASAAFAESEWLASGAVITTAQATDSTGTIELEDMKQGILVTCTATTDKGTVGPGKKDTVTSVTFSGCTSAQVKIEKVEAVNLPWNTEILLSGTKFFDDITSGGSGSPGYKITGVLLGIKISDTCTKAESKVELVNLVSEVEALFNTEEKAACSLGGEEGLVHGKEKILLESGLTLAVS